LSDGRPVILSRTRSTAVRPLNEVIMKNVAPELLTHPSSVIPHPSFPQPIAAFCAVGNPSAFFTHLRSDRYELSHTRAFPDHYIYQQTDVDAFVVEAKRAGARALLTTAKDAVKVRALSFDLPCYVLEIGLEFDDEEKLMGMILEAIEKRSA
jgi:tetraacyldisaccharide-1-P 4'-kinase